jgi:hypothetical protein
VERTEGQGGGRADGADGGGGGGGGRLGEHTFGTTPHCSARMCFGGAGEAGSICWDERVLSPGYAHGTTTPRTLVTSLKERARLSTPSAWSIRYLVTFAPTEYTCSAIARNASGRRIVG